MRRVCVEAARWRRGGGAGGGAEAVAARLHHCQALVALAILIGVPS
jgi:hypothetical protein